jgi:hypothetical protein
VSIAERARKWTARKYRPDWLCPDEHSRVPRSTAASSTAGDAAAVDRRQAGLLI